MYRGQFHTNEEGVDSISEQFNILNEATEQHKKQFSNKRSDIVIMQGLSRYHYILNYIENLNWDLKSQEYLIKIITNLKTKN